MLLITKEIKKQLEKNATNTEQDHKPVLKLFNPVGAATWLLTELKDGIAFGLCDLGQGTPEIGYVSINELSHYQAAFGLKIERDLHFKATKTLSEYATDARNQGSITA